MTTLLSILIMSVLVIIVFLMTNLFKSKLNASIRYLIWVILIFGFLIPIRPMFGDGLITFETPMVYTTDPFHAMPVIQIDEDGNQLVTREPIINSVEAPRFNLEFEHIALIVWLTGTVGILGFTSFKYLRFQKAISRFGEAEEDAPTLALFEQVKQEMGLENSKIKLIVAGFVSSSMLTGFFKPVILLPERNFCQDELRLIFEHELIHYKRHDLWLKLAALVALAINWFNPLIYLANFAMQAEGEASCDAIVLSNKPTSERQFYAEVIVGMIGPQKSGSFMLATNFYGGKKGINRRLSEIINPKPGLASLSVLTFLGTVIAIIFSGSALALEVAPPVTFEEAVPVVGVDTNLSVEEKVIAFVGGGSIVELIPVDEYVTRFNVVYNDAFFYVEINMDTLELVSLTHTSPSTTEEISIIEAGEIALAAFPGTSREVDSDMKMDVAVWYAEIERGGLIYAVYIDRVSGEIIYYEYWDEN